MDDPRYPPDAIQYVFVVHNHPYEGEISRNDIRFIVEQGRFHGFTVKTPEREIPIGIIAFYSRSGHGGVTCDGFYQYIPLTGELFKWSVDEKKEWKKERYGRVKWRESGDFDIEYD